MLWSFKESPGIAIVKINWFEKGYELVMKDGNSDIYCNKHQPPYSSKEWAEELFQTNFYLINKKFPLIWERDILAL